MTSHGVGIGRLGQLLCESRISGHEPSQDQPNREDGVCLINHCVPLPDGLGNGRPVRPLGHGEEARALCSNQPAFCILHVSGIVGRAYSDHGRCSRVHRFHVGLGRFGAGSTGSPIECRSLHLLVVLIELRLYQTDGRGAPVRLYSFSKSSMNSTREHKTPTTSLQNAS